MAGTNKKKSLLFFNPSIILKDPQLPENIGMVARTMVNFGFKYLKIVNPKKKWPNVKSISASAGALNIIGKHTKVFKTLEESLQDISFLCACTVRLRDMEKRIVDPRKLMRAINLNYQNERVGFLFGSEKSGLSNKDLSKANLIIEIPTNQGFGSLNLAMAVNIICYEWYYLNNKIRKMKKKTSEKSNVNLDKIDLFSNSLLNTLNKIGFYKNTKQKDKLIINIKNLVAKARLTEKELKMLYGIIKALKNYQINN